MNIKLIKTKEELISFTNEMDVFYTDIIEYINLIIEQTNKLILNNELKLTDIENLLNIFVLSIDMLIQKKYTRTCTNTINIIQGDKTYTLFVVPKYRIKFYKKKLIGKLVFNDEIEECTYLLGYKLNSDNEDINLLKQYLIVIKKRFIRLNNFFTNKKSELLLYFNNMILLN